MSAEAPTWIDEKFIRTCLQNQEDDKAVVIKSFRVESATPSGNNYTSKLWRVAVVYHDGQNEKPLHLSLILKEPSENSPISRFFDAIWAIESTFYKKFIPLASKLLPNDRFVPKNFYCSVPNVIVMVDLKSEGYSMADRCKLLDFDHCRLYVKAAATLHATSVAINKKDPALIEYLGADEKVLSHDPKKSILSKQILMDGLEYLAEKTKSMDAFKKYARLMRESGHLVWDQIIEVHKRSKKLNVLLQADPWTTNMMFKYDPTGKVTDIRLLDFQVPRFSLPLSDLVYFIWLCANHQVREYRLEDLYHIYRTTLNQKLEECNCPERLSQEEFQENLRDLRPYALFVSVALFPFFTSNIPVDLTSYVSENQDTTRSLVSKYYNPDYCNGQLQRILKQLENAGVFEYLKEHLPDISHEAD